MAELQSELQNLRTQLEESLDSHEEAQRSLAEQVGELKHQRQRTQQEVSSLSFDLFSSSSER